MIEWNDTHAYGSNTLSRGYYTVSGGRGFFSIKYSEAADGRHIVLRHATEYAGSFRSVPAAKRRALEIVKGIADEDRAAAARALRAAYAAQGLDADAEVEGIATMTAEQLRDELTYLADYQG